MRIIVAGAGIGGLAAALALARGGAEVEVLERARAFGELGAGLQLAPNATRILFGWGLEDRLRASAFAPASVDIRDRADARLLLRTTLGEEAVARWGAPYLQMHRADLHAVLAQAAQAAGARLRLGVEAGEVEDDGDRVRLQTAQGPLEAEALVAADGLRSTLRDRLFDAAPARFTGEVAWRGLVASDAMAPGLVAPAATVWTARNRHFVHYYVRGGAQISFVGFTPARHRQGESWREAADPGEIARAFAGWPAPVEALIAALYASGDPGWRWALHRRATPSRWVRGRTVLLGDAAHPMAPFLAQGAGMAVEDAECLARCVLGGEPISAGLAAYARERRPRTARVQAWAARNGRLFHLPGALRRAAFATAALTPLGDLDWLYGYRPG